MTASAVSRVGSISKSVTAVVLMRLVDRGVVSLDEPVERHLPEVRGPVDPITPAREHAGRAP